MISRAIEPVTDIQGANKATAARFVGAFNHNDWDTVREIVADGFVFHHPIGGTVVAGPEGMVTTWASFKHLSPDSWHPIPILIAEGDFVAVLLPTYGHFTGRSDQAPPPTGGRLDYGMVNMVRIEAGKLAEMWFGMDPLVELQQMGVAPGFPLRPHTQLELANLAAFVSNSGLAPTDFDSVTAFGDTVIACSPPQASPSSAARLVEVHRFASDGHTLVYRHAIPTDPPYGGDPACDTRASRATIGRWFDEVLRGHDRTALAELVSPDVLVHPTAMPCEAGFYAAAGMEEWLGAQWAAFPDLTVVDDLSVASGDIVAVHWHALGTSRGAFMGLDPTGQGVGFTGISMYRVEAGRIAEVWETRNTLAILHQLDPRIGGGHHH
jgi:predicted ester cyclase